MVYQASLDSTGRRGRPAFIITAEHLHVTLLLEHSATEDRILPRHIGSVHGIFRQAAKALQNSPSLPRKRFDEIFGGIGTAPAL